jgi:hypothetical protein
MNIFLIVPTASGITAIEADETLTSVVVRTFPTQTAARQWALDRLDSLALEERALIQEEILDGLTGSVTVH